LHVDDLDAVLGVVTQLQIHMSSGAKSGVIAPSIPAPWVGVAEPRPILRRMKPRSINRRIRNVAAARDGALDFGKIHAAAGASDDLGPGPPVIRVQRKRPLPDTTAQRGAGWRHAGHGVGKQCRENYVALSRASSDGARCAALAAGYHNHRWKD